MNLVTPDYLLGLATPAVVEDDVWAQSAIVVQRYDAFSRNGLAAIP